MPAPLADLLAADGAEARHAIVDALIRACGHEWMTYGSLEASGNGWRPCALWTAHAHAGWMERYGARDYREVDPRLDAAAASSLPVAWTLEALAGRLRIGPSNSAARWFVADIGQAGIRSGVCLVLPGEGEDRRHFMSLESSTASDPEMSGEMVGQVLMLGLCLNEYFTRHVALPWMALRTVEGLSCVQREILGHVARGESDKRIAHLLCMSSHTVDYHMRRLRHRFAARNRVQLAKACGNLLR
jgi:DNA-binding CsgD family transcriptional regulator